MFGLHRMWQLLDYLLNFSSSRRGVLQGVSVDISSLLLCEHFSSWI